MINTLRGCYLSLDTTKFFMSTTQKTTPQELLAKLKAVFTAAKQNFADEGGEPKEYSTAGNETVLIDKLEAGGVVKGKDGNPVAAGTLTLADGQVLTIGENGTITDIKPAEKPEEKTDMPTQQMLREMVAKFADGTPEERIQKLETMVVALMNYSFGWDIQQEAKNAAIATYKENYAQQFEAVVEENTKLKTQLQAASSGIAELAGVVEGLLTLPSEKPLETQKSAFAAVAGDKTDRVNKLLGIAKALQPKPAEA